MCSSCVAALLYHTGGLLSCYPIYIFLRILMDEKWLCKAANRHFSGIIYAVSYYLSIKIRIEGSPLQGAALYCCSSTPARLGHGCSVAGALPGGSLGCAALLASGRAQARPSLRFAPSQGTGRRGWAATLADALGGPVPELGGPCARRHSCQALRAALRRLRLAQGRGQSDALRYRRAPPAAVSLNWNLAQRPRCAKFIAI